MISHVESHAAFSDRWDGWCTRRKRKIISHYWSIAKSHRAGWKVLSGWRALRDESGSRLFNTRNQVPVEMGFFRIVWFRYIYQKQTKVVTAKGEQQKKNGDYLWFGLIGESVSGWAKRRCVTAKDDDIFACFFCSTADDDGWSNYTKRSDINLAL